MNICYLPLLPLALTLPLACSLQAATEPPKQACAAQKLNPDALLRLDTPWPNCDGGGGGGIFGGWTVDDRGLPAYDYSFRQESNPLALYANSMDDERRTHWHGFGNDRTTALFYNHGGVEMLATERGILSLNRIDPESGHWGGAIATILGNGAPITTLAWNNPDIRRRRFTLDGAEVEAARDGIVLTHRIWSPDGDTPVIYVEDTVRNDSRVTQSLTVLESWDINAEQRFFGLVGSGLQKARAGFNANFGVDARWSASDARVTLRYPPHKKQPPGPSEKVYDYPLVFLADPDAQAQAGYVSPETVGFTATGQPDIHLGNPIYSLLLPSAEGAKVVMTLRWNLQLAPGESKQMRSVFGYRYAANPPVETLTQFTGSWHENGLNRAQAGVFVASNGAPWLTREMAWHASMLSANSMYDQYHGAHVYNQGSTYGYLQGGTGAPRDETLALLPAIYFRPDLAKENLRFIMRTTDTQGRIFYALLGYGVLTGALIHENPSDLDLFFLWGLSEYLLATRDFTFLNEEIAYYDTPITAQSKVRDHARKAIQHLTQAIGIGAHGLIRLRDGDWNDGITLRAEDVDAARLNGESTFDAALAAYVLPRLADAVEKSDLETAAAARSIAAGQAAAFDATWQNQWYLRAYEDVDRPVGDTQIFLEHHAFALLANIVPDDRRKTLLDAIDKHLVGKSPIGQRILYPADKGSAIWEEGWDVNGGIWHAMNGVLTAAYAGFDGERAWDSLLRNSMHRHADAYPEIWYGIWSGPDSYNAEYAKRPGETFLHIATPMVDFPVMNSNQHAMPLYALFRGYGLEATAGGLRVQPAFTSEPFVMRLPWVQVSGGPANLAVRLQALYADERWVTVAWPPKAAGTVRVVRGKADVVDGKRESSVRWFAQAGEELLVTVE